MASSSSMMADMMESLTAVSFRVHFSKNFCPMRLSRGFLINQIKLELRDYVDIPVNEMVLTYAGERLENTRTLSCYNIQDDSELHLTRDRKVFLFMFLKNLFIF